MKVTIGSNNVVTLTPEGDFEEYAMRHWVAANWEPHDGNNMTINDGTWRGTGLAVQLVTRDEHGFGHTQKVGGEP